MCIYNNIWDTKYFCVINKRLKNKTRTRGGEETKNMNDARRVYVSIYNTCVFHVIKI